MQVCVFIYDVGLWVVLLGTEITEVYCSSLCVYL